jgi:hypothetical protein
LTGLVGVVRNRRGREDEAAKVDRAAFARGKALTSGLIGFIVFLFTVQQVLMRVSRCVVMYSMYSD